MGGGIGQWLLFRAGDRSLTLFALVVPSGSQTPIHDHLAWGLVGLYRGTQDEEIYARDDGGALERVEARALAPGDFYALLPPRDDIHRVRTTSPETSVSLHLLTNDTGCVWRHAFDEHTGEASPFRSGYVNVDCEAVIQSARARASTRPSVLSSADAVWCLRPSEPRCQPVAITGSPTVTQSSRSTASRASRLGWSQSHSGGV